MRSKVRVITHCALLAAVTAVLAQISFPVGPFPFTMGIFGVMLCGGLLRPLPAFLAQVAYVALGAVGLPVFSGFQGGFQCLLGPTGGFLMAYPLVALIVSLLCRRRGRSQVLGYVLALFPCYLIGAGWYAGVSRVDLLTALAVTVLPFVLFDALKAVAAAFVAAALNKRLGLR